MLKIAYYYLYYTPGGSGRVVFRVQGENQDRSTPALSATEFAALAAVLAQKNIVYYPNYNSFASFDNDENPITSATPVV